MVVFINGINLFPQSSNFPRILYVNAADGLRRRAEPSTNSITIGTYLHGERIQVLERSNLPVTINGITDYWYKTNAKFSFGNTFYDFSWVFGGYLSENLPLDVPVILGKWDDKQSSWPYRYYFSPDNRYAQGALETGGDFYGTWDLNGNTITLVRSRSDTGYDLDENQRVYETVYVHLIVIDRDNIDLRFQDDTIVRLKRSKDTW